MADFLKSIFDKVIQSYVLKLYYATCSGVCHCSLVLLRADDDTHQISSATQFSAQQEGLKNKQIEDEQESKETKLVEGII